MFWPVQILAAVDGLAVLQVPGGLVVVDDPQGQLEVGAVTTVVTTPPDEAPAPGVQLGTWTVQRAAQLAILRREAAEGCPPVRMPLFVLPEDDLGARVQLTVALPVACPRCDPADAWSYLLNNAEAPTGLYDLFNAILPSSLESP